MSPPCCSPSAATPSGFRPDRSVRVLPLQSVARSGWRLGHEGQILGRHGSFDGFGDVIELNPDAVQPPASHAKVAPILDDNAFDGRHTPKQAHTVALAKGAR